MESDDMVYLFTVIYEVPDVYLVTADNEADAWKLFLCEVYGFCLRNDGLYVTENNGEYEDINSALYDVGVLSDGNGGYADSDGNEYPTIDAIRFAYNVNETKDGKFTTSMFRVCKSVDDVMTVIPRPVQICEMQMPIGNVQLVGTLKPPVGAEYTTAKRLISETHREQAKRYIELRQHSRAIMELRSSIRLERRASKLFKDYQTIGDCYVSQSSLSLAVKAYENALRHGTVFDGRDRVYLKIASCFDMIENFEDAIGWYSKISDDELSPREVNAARARVRELLEMSSAIT